MKCLGRITTNLSLILSSQGGDDQAPKSTPHDWLASSPRCNQWQSWAGCWRSGRGPMRRQGGRVAAHRIDLAWNGYSRPSGWLNTYNNPWLRSDMVAHLVLSTNDMYSAIYTDCMHLTIPFVYKLHRDYPTVRRRNLDPFIY